MTMPRPSLAARMRMLLAHGGRALAILYAAAFCVFLLLPIMVVVPVSFSDAEIIEFPPSGYSLRWYESIASQGTWVASMGVSFKIAIVAALVSTVAGLLIGLATFRFGQLGQSTRLLFLLPLLIPHVTLATGLFVALLEWRLLGNWVILSIANAALSLPITMVLFIGAYQAMDRNLWTAASTLGARTRQILSKVILPLSAIAILIALIMSFEKAWDEVTLAVFIGPSVIPPLPSAMYSELLQQSTPIVGAVSAILLGITVLLIAIVGVLRRRAEAVSRQPAEEE